MLRAVARPSDAVYVLAKSAVAVSGAADTNENVLATISIPAGAIGANGVIRVYSLWSCTNNANGKTARVRLGGVGGTAFLALSLANQASYSDVRLISNRNSQSSQVGPNTQVNGGAGVVGATVTTAAIDTSAATTLVLTAQKASAGDTFTLDAYLVEIIYGA